MTGRARALPLQSIRMARKPSSVNPFTRTLAKRASSSTTRIVTPGKALPARVGVQALRSSSRHAFELGCILTGTSRASRLGSCLRTRSNAATQVDNELAHVIRRFGGDGATGNASRINRDQQHDSNDHSEHDGHGAPPSNDESVSYLSNPTARWASRSARTFDLNSGSLMKMRAGRMPARV